MPKNVQTTAQLHLFHVSKVMLKILQARLQQYINQEFPDVQTGLRKGGGPRDQIANIYRIIEKGRKFRKTSTSVSLSTLKCLTMWITINCGKFSKRWEYQTTYLPPEKPVCGSRTTELDMEQWTSSKLGKQHIKAVYCHLAYLT